MLHSVLAYINSHLDENISLDELAKVTGYSPYHLHRKLKEELQEPIGGFIVRQRMQTAAYLLCLTELPVSEIGLLVGYENDSAFSRAFKSTMGATPKAFRKQQDVHSKDLQQAQYVSLKCEVVRLPEQQAIVFPSIGNYFSRDIYKVWDKVKSFIESENLTPADFIFMGVLHDCQNVNPQSLCRYDAAIICKKDTKLNVNKNFITTLPGGKFAKYRFCCPVTEYANIGGLINSHLQHEAHQKHAYGISYFRFQTLPTHDTADNLFIEWFIPIN
ncbi:AraC family transcriptional regulator [Pontibacter akesuensis]|uniref:Transcriptional regulator, AraC family n=1 Tax=Pontibacter akesuensis TaxID=388950 RepID=A0A1I7I2Z6_9BACT|nr:AraC family transcriptional regulator [Pontibacter akesuensis]GHA64853.1 AraC family transcriptional regulator [Pontibacter akesuensis]SFU67136.1 transcriptional regulator, AraC family [Pontibacter akesuensis]